MSAPEPSDHGPGRAAVNMGGETYVSMSPANRDNGKYPTQIAYPKRAAFRTTVAAAIAMIPVFVSVSEEFGLSEIPWVAATLAGCAAITRILALPAVELWLQEFMPWLAASEYQPQHAKEEDNA